jgi:deoxyxylulose-5-phosphate synthase
VDGKTPLWNAADAWTAVTPYRERKGARAAILAMGAPSFLAGTASDRLAEQGTAVDVYVINGFPVDEAFFNSLPGKYGRVVTLEDGLIGTVDAGLRGFAAHVAGRFAGCGLTLDHIGIVDPQIAPSDAYLQVWEHYGMTVDALIARVKPSPA